MSSLFDPPMRSPEVVSALALDWSHGMLAATGKGRILREGRGAREGEAQAMFGIG